MLIPEASATPAGVLPRMKRFTVLGTFSAGMYEYDSALALVALPDAQRLVRLGDAVSGVRLRLADLMQAPAVAQRLAQRLPYLAVGDWTRQHVNFFRAVRTEKTVMFIILSLIVGVAAFNIISTLVMMVADKRADIAILRTMGATPGSVMGVFIVQGAVIGVVGTLLGLLGGVALALNIATLVPWLERALHVSLWPTDVYYISSLPSRLQAGDVTRITAWRCCCRCWPRCTRPGGRPAPTRPRRCAMSNPTPVLEARGLGKTYLDAGGALTVLHDVDLTVQAGESVAVMGASGAGKSTLLHLLGGLDAASHGEVWVDGRSLTGLGERERSRLRNQSLGFIYQFHHLLDEFTARENIAMPLLIGGMAPARAGRGGRRHAGPARVLPSAATTSRASCPAASVSGSPSAARWSPARAASWPTSRPATWTRTPPSRCSSNWSRCAASAAAAWWWSPTTRNWRGCWTGG